ncbi:anti-sigma-I factor RsgI family protein [Alkalihalobacillus deserti]|uniref:anti-sigma-I factor RsgI family protein n=1 Tax=Alkalihalobacillus deserti TaxID=2879466 RepID=UPI001D14B3A6|nr:hypothetical protein [Alkalihalobacillus deserti]
MNRKTINGTVLKVTETKIVLLTKEGTFKNVPKPSTEIPLIGQAYSYRENKKINNRLLQYGAMAVALLFLIFTSFTFPFGGSAEEAFIVTIDINPSIEVTTDDQYHVIRAEGLNEDGQKILAALQLEKNLSDAIQQIMEETIRNGFVQVEEPLIATSVVPLEKDSEEVISILEQAIHISLEEHQIVSKVIVSNEEKELYEEAKEHDLSVNYYKEFKVLEASGIVKKQNEIKGKTLAELKRMENKERKEDKQKGAADQIPKKNTPAVERSNSDHQKKNKETKPAADNNKNQSEHKVKQKENVKRSTSPDKKKDTNNAQQGNKEQGPDQKGKSSNSDRNNSNSNSSNNNNKSSEHGARN